MSQNGQAHFKNVCQTILGEKTLLIFQKYIFHDYEIRVCRWQLHEDYFFTNC